MNEINNLMDKKYLDYFNLLDDKAINKNDYDLSQEEEKLEITSLIQRHYCSKIMFIIPKDRKIEPTLLSITEETKKKKKKLKNKKIIIFNLESFVYGKISGDNSSLFQELKEIFETLNKTKDYILYIKSSAEILFKEDIKHFFNYIFNNYSNTIILALNKDKFTKISQNSCFNYDNFITYHLKTHKKIYLKRKLTKEKKYLENHYQIKCNTEHFNLIIDLCKKYQWSAIIKPLETSNLLELAFSIASYNKTKKLNTMDIYRALSLLTNLPIDLIKREEKSVSITKHYKNEKKEYKEILSQIEKSLIYYQNTKEYRQNKAKSLIFLGTTGTGKNYIGKKLAEFYCGDKNNLITVDLDLFSGEEKIAMDIKIFNSIKQFLYKKIKEQPMVVIYIENSSYASEETLNELSLIINQGYIENNKDKVSIQHTIFIFALTEVGDTVVNKEIGFIKEKVNDALTIDDKLLFIFELAEELIEFPLPSKEFLIKVSKEKEKNIKKKYKKNYDVNVIFEDSISEYVANNSIQNNNFIHEVKYLYDNTIEHTISDLLTEGFKNKQITFDIKEQELTFR